MTPALALAEWEAFFAVWRAGLSMDMLFNRIPVVVAAGMDFEARIARGPGINVVYGQDRKTFLEQLYCSAGSGVGGVISFGIGGGLSPYLRAGDVIVANKVITPNGVFETCPNWTQALLNALPHAYHMPVFGADGPVVTVLEKRALWHATGAGTADMESGAAATVAFDHELPYAVLRVVLDPHDRPIPLSALAGAQKDGKTDAAAVARALLRRPGDFPGLLRLADDTRRATQALFRSRQALGLLPSFALPETRKLAVDMD